MKTSASVTDIILLLMALMTVASSAPPPKILNNFVTELLNVKLTQAPMHKTYTFSNPKTGWVFIASTARVEGSGKISLTIDSSPEGTPSPKGTPAPTETPVLVHGKGGTETQEAMRLLSAGLHTIRIHSEGKPSLKSLVVRAIPEMGWVTLQNWDFMQKNGIRNYVNVMVDYGRSRQREHEQYMRPWKDAGKHWLVMCPMPGFTADKSVTLRDSYKFWSDLLVQNPNANGFLADEIGPLQTGYKESFPLWADAIRKLKQEFPDREASIYCCGPILTEAEAESLRPVIEALHETDGRFVLEAYLTEKPTLEAATAHLKVRLHDETVILQKVYPGFARDTVLAIGAFDRFGPELNACPHVDFRVFLDMQLQRVATDPGWGGLKGIQPYLTYHMTEETQRWFSKLLRHYCIEGKSSLLSEDYGWKYMLDHIHSPDFEAGTYGYWSLSDETTMKHKVMLGLPYMQGRYDVDTHENLLQGSSFLWTKRKANAPNIFSQEVKNLQPGKCYSVKVWVGDHKDLKANQPVISSIAMEDADLIPEKSVTWSYGIGVINGEYFTLYYRVFRARGDTAKLQISDWADAKNPGGPVGQELMYNFIEVQPYLEEELRK